MKNISSILFSCIIVVLSACANSESKSSSMAIGEIGPQQLLSEYQYFQQSYRMHNLTEEELLEVHRWPKGLHVDVFFATWCHDSQREVPRFLKVLNETAGMTSRLIGLDYNKSEPNGTAKKHDIKFTPTFIVYRDNKEIGRIIERPKISLTVDISSML